MINILLCSNNDINKFKALTNILDKLEVEDYSITQCNGDGKIIDKIYLNESHDYIIDIRYKMSEHHGIQSITSKALCIDGNDNCIATLSVKQILTNDEYNKFLNLINLKAIPETEKLLLINQEAIFNIFKAIENEKDKEKSFTLKK